MNSIIIVPLFLVVSAVVKKNNHQSLTMLLEYPFFKNIHTCIEHEDWQKKNQRIYFSKCIH